MSNPHYRKITELLRHRGPVGDAVLTDEGGRNVDLYFGKQGVDVGRYSPLLSFVHADLTDCAFFDDDVLEITGTWDLAREGSEKCILQEGPGFIHVRVKRLSFFREMYQTLMH